MELYDVAYSEDTKHIRQAVKQLVPEYTYTEKE